MYIFMRFKLSPLILSINNIFNSYVVTNIEFIIYYIILYIHNFNNLLLLNTIKFILLIFFFNNYFITIYIHVYV